MNMQILILAVVGCFLLLGCSHSETAYAINPEKSPLVTAKTLVQTTTAIKAPFNVEIYSKGTVEAYRKATMKFQQEGMISVLAIANGDFVSQGTVVARQATEQLDIEKEQLALSIAKAQLDYEDLLLKMGYNTAVDSVTIPEQILDMAQIRSGLREYKISRLKLNEKYRQSILIAPFSGYIAEVEAQANNLSSSYQQVGILMDLNRIWVTFKILEEEIRLIDKGDQVEIIPFGNQEAPLLGVLTEINPLVDKNGLVTIRALVKNNKTTLLEGMHTDVRILKSVGNQIALPKSAVLDRNGKDVVFLHKGGKAHWAYVEKAYENQDSICIVNGISSGDEIIITGHLTLAHQADIQVDSIGTLSF